jgi:hypothetical protein
MRVANFTGTDAIQFQRGRIVATSVAGFGPQGPQGPVGPIGPVGGVDSVNSQTGVVVLGASDVGAYPDTNPSNFVDAAGASAAAPVQSVNTQTGTVVLGASDVGAYPDTNPSSFVDAAGAAAAAPVQSVDSLTGAVDLVPRYAVASDTAPVSPFVGQRWVQTSTGRLAYWTGLEWVEIGALGLDLSVAAADPAFTGAFLPLGAIPTGGATGQVLVKDSGTNYDTAWDDIEPKAVPVDNTGTRYFGVPGGSLTVSGTVLLSGNRPNSHYSPFVVRHPITISELQYEVTNSPSPAAEVTVSIVDADDEWQPIAGTQRLVSALIAHTTANVTTVTGLSETLQSGRYLTEFNQSLSNQGFYRSFGVPVEGLAIMDLTSSPTIAARRLFSATSGQGKWSSAPATNVPNSAGVIHMVLYKWSLA